METASRTQPPFATAQAHARAQMSLQILRHGQNGTDLHAHVWIHVFCTACRTTLPALLNALRRIQDDVEGSSTLLKGNAFKTVHSTLSLVRRENELMDSQLFSVSFQMPCMMLTRLPTNPNTISQLQASAREARQRTLLHRLAADRCR